ncbi:MAG: cupredoxin domain-containing protein [Candidatus Omnitrophota bacterium]
MKKSELIAVILMFLATIGTIVGIYAIEKFRISRFYTVELIAREPNNGNWYPRQIKVPLGKEVRLYIRNIETVSHGFAIPDFEVAIDEIKAGNVEVVRFTPDKKGTFPFMCTVWCSERHMEMNGELIVE